MAYLTTKQLCEALGASRSWINNYLREFGIKNGEDNNAIFYDEEIILNYINKNASFQRQTEMVDASEWVPRGDLERRKNDTEDIPKRLADAEMAAMLRLYAPDEVVAIKDKKAASRSRGAYAWRCVHGVYIDSLNQLEKIESIRSSPELAYRKIFLSGAIKVELHGKVWFAFTENIQEFPVLIEARA